MDNIKKITKTKLPNKSGQPISNIDIPKKDWFEHAACKGKTSLMFPKQHKDITYIAEARALCRGCSVKTPCLAYALQYPTADIHGVWAGLTSRQLAAKQKKLGIKPTKPTLAQLWGD